MSTDKKPRRKRIGNRITLYSFDSTENALIKLALRLRASPYSQSWSFKDVIDNIDESIGMVRAEREEYIKQTSQL